MSYSRGDQNVVGVAIETVRGTKVAPQDYLRLREPADVNTELESVNIAETKANGFDAQDNVITASKVVGALNGNLRFRTIGYFLKSFFGGYSVALEAGESAVYRHTFTLNPALLQPTLTLALARAGFTHKSVAGAVVDKIALSASLDDMIQTAIGIMGIKETTETNYTPSFVASDYLAPHQMITLKLATNVAGLAGATAVCVTNQELEMKRDSKAKLCMSSVFPADFFAKLFQAEGKFVWEKDTDLYKDLAEANTAQALQITINNTSQLLGVASSPKLIITFPKVMLTTKESRPLDDVITEEISYKVLYDDTLSQGVTIDLVNTKTTYAT